MRRAAYAVLMGLAACGQEPQVQVGSKKFTESVILGEVATQLLSEAGLRAQHHSELGGTRVLWEGLVSGEIDVYVEYTGTLRADIFAGEALDGEGALEQALAARGVHASAPIGFNNTYALGMREERAASLGIRTVSDLARHPELVLGFGNEFLDRGDGWPSLAATYGLRDEHVIGLDHDLAYRGLEAGEIDVMDMYSTDAEIGYYGLRALEDDRGHFPTYDALVLWRADLEQRAPRAVAALRRLEGRIDEAQMIALNAEAKLEAVAEGRVAAGFLERALGIRNTIATKGFWARLLDRTLEHLLLVGVSLGAAILVAIPLGVFAFLRPRTGRVLLAAAGILQTVPSFAMLVFMIPLLGLGAPPAIAALFLYSLLPILRGTHAGLAGVPRELIDSATALGLPRSARLRLVELPLAVRSILAGVQTSAVINVGTATLGALIGARGYGQPILTGIRKDDMSLILEGAVPAALLALLVQGLFEYAERRLLSPGLRLASQGVD